MNITYKNIKELPNEKLRELFIAVGWSKGNETDFMLNNFNKPFLNSTYIFSAWDNDNLVGCVRVISDKVVRSVIQDLCVLPKYQKLGIGTTLLKKCIDLHPKSEWLVVTTKDVENFYKKNGFNYTNLCYLTIPSQWF